MFHHLQKSIQSAVARHIETRYGITASVTVEQPKQPEFGELALPIAFQLAKSLRKAPKAIAAELQQDLAGLPGVAALEVAGNGYLNVRLSRGAYASALLGAETSSGVESAGKIIVEHTNINPNKAAHIGHLRNAILGDTFVRMLRSSGRDVEVQNYIDNTGVQVADVVVGFHYLNHNTPDEVRQLIQQDRFDYLCWDLYARTSAYYAENKDALAWRAETLHAVEAGEGVQAELAHLIADAIVQRHLRTMLRIGIEYDVLPRESEILHLKFWASAFELLKERKAIYFETQGKNSGCWVMPGSAFSDRTGDEDSKVIVRSNGTVTYVGKDIAYQLWKFGLLGKDFYYRLLMNYPDGHPLWVTTDEPQTEANPNFGKGERVYNVIDSRQSYLQDVVVAGLKALGYDDAASRSIHFSYEMVALTPRTCAELGIELSEEDQRRAYVEVSGRKGLGVKADDLIDKLISNALFEVESRNANASPEDRQRIARQIAVAALRYFMLKFTRNTVIAFDFQEALSFTGETGPYVQYATTRARKILGKHVEAGGAIPDCPAVLNEEILAKYFSDEGLWQALLAASKFEAAVQSALDAGEPAQVAKYAFELAQSFSNFYHEYPVLKEPDPSRKVLLLWMASYFGEQLGRTLDVLGIEAPDFM